MANKTQNKVDSLIAMHINQIDELIKSNLLDFKLHEIELDKRFAYLITMKQIDRNIVFEVENKLKQL